MRKYIVFIWGVCFLCFLLLQGMAMASVSQEYTGQQSQDQKQTYQRGKERTVSERSTQELRKQLEKALQKVMNEGVKKSTQRQLSRIKEKSRSLSVKKTRNLAQEIMQTAYLVLLDHGDTDFSQLFAVTPKTFGITAELEDGSIDLNYKQLLETYASSGFRLRDADIPEEPLKEAAVKAIYLSAWLADAMRQMPDSGDFDAESILECLQKWLEYTANDFLSVQYNPKNKIWNRLQKIVWKSPVKFAGSLQKYQIGPAILDLSGGFV